MSAQARTGTAVSPLREQVRLTVNGKLHRFSVEPRTTLLDVLRDRLRYTHTKEGCSVGECCSCAVIVNDRMVNACLQLAMDCDGARIVTLEGMGASVGSQPLPESFIDHPTIPTRPRRG